MTPGSELIVEAFAPFLLLLIYGRIKLKRQRAKANAKDYSEPAFASGPIKAPRGLTALGSRLFPGLNTAEQAYLELHLKQVRTFFLAGVYAVTCITTSGLFSGSYTYGLDRQSGLYLWLNFLRGWSLASIALSLLALGAAFVLGTQFGQGSTANLYRTRPVSLTFLFWIRTSIATLTLLASLIAGFALSLLIFVALHGPAWRPLTHTIGLTMAPGVVRLDNGGSFNAVIRGLMTSPLRLALCSILNTIAVYAFYLAILLQAMRLKGKALRSVFGVAFGGVVVTNIAFIALPFRYTRVLFLYPKLGPPPPYIFAVVPLALIAAFLYLARISYTYLES